MANLRIPLSKFWDYVEQTETCWLWKGTRYPTGYGRLGGGNNGRYAHRVAYELCHGPFPQHMKILHHCDNPPCVRPDHLFLGTDADNVRDKVEKGRQGLTAKLTPAQVLEIRASVGLSQRALAWKYGVRKATIYYIQQRRTWKHI